MYPRRNGHFSQLPPRWSSWFDAFKLLIDFGASVHEDVCDRAISTLNLTQGHNTFLSSTEPSAIEFFSVLHDESYSEFDVTGAGVWSAILTAIRTKTRGPESLQFLHKVGVDLARVFDTGQCSLHLAAELAYDVEMLEYLCSTSAIENINRQDEWEWTPLHYAVASGYYGHREIALDKVKCLLRHGADLNIKGKEHPLLFREFPSQEAFTPLELSKLVGSSFHYRFEEAATSGTATMQEALGERDEESFFDALEDQIWIDGQASFACL